ncbi:hypothetical protein [Aquabacter cavernae]|uniref:hypothetical protein n=1 Tax=Aquabacter cavernae TaxID=2496029 RepID=UPI0013DF56AA|nr:hypothetical protein [Aquabacter cavernae]
MGSTDKPLLRALVQHFRGDKERDVASVLQTLMEANKAHPLHAAERQAPPDRRPK